MLTKCAAQLCCKNSHCVLGEVADHLPVGVQVSCAAVVTHCGRRATSEPASVAKREAVTLEEFGRRVSQDRGVQSGSEDKRASPNALRFALSSCVQT